MSMLRLALLLACCAMMPAGAHDFWIQPAHFVAAGDSAMPFTLQVGHTPDRQRSRIALKRLAQFVELRPDGHTVDLRAALGMGQKDSDGSIALHGAGVHVLVLETDRNAQSHLPAARFNAYLREEGLAPALRHRAATAMDSDGFERYGRVAKALIQVGPAGMGSQQAATKAIGLPLEIVFDRSPYALPRPAVLPIHVMYQGQRLAGGLVKLTNLDSDAAPLATLVTDAEGKGQFAMPAAGNWLLNIVWTMPVPASEGIDFETLFSSVSFAVPK
jgi:uncharacterized GH25 family protein